jgi:hypothetical protein
MNEGKNRAVPRTKPTPPSSPPLTREQAMDRRAAADFEQMDRANRKPVSLDLRAAPWTRKGGGSGFTIR